MTQPDNNIKMATRAYNNGWIKFIEIFMFELKYQLTRLWTWLIFLTLLAISFLMTRDGSLAEALHDEFFLNSPFAIAKTTVVGSLVWLMASAALAGDAAARDVASGMHIIVYTFPVHKSQYLGGKFLAAFITNAWVLVAVQAGILLGVYLPGVDEELIGPMLPAAYLTAYGYIAIPNAFVATALQFSLSTKSGRPMAAYMGSLILFFMSYVVGLFLLFQGRQDLANLLDLIGVHFILSELSHLWTPIEKSTRLITLEGTVLTNRLIWMGAGMFVLAVTYIRFRFTTISAATITGIFVSLVRKIGLRHQSRSAGPGSGNPLATIPVTARFKALISPSTVSYERQYFDWSFHLRQTSAIARVSFLNIAKSWTGLVLLIVIPLLTILVVVDQMVINEVPLIPKTGRVLSELTASLSAEMSRWVIIPLVIIFFAGELVWREREAGLEEITDAMPGSEWPHFIGKFLGLALVLVLFLFLLAIAGMVAQLMMDYHEFEAGLYLKTLFGLQLPEYLLFAVLAIFLHVLANQKYIGHLAGISAYVFISLSSLFGINHNLLIYGSGPAWLYTEMSGFGNSVWPWLAFKIYWTGWAILLAVAIRLLWLRGKKNHFKTRLRIARLRIDATTLWTASISSALIVIMGGLIYHNTNVLNVYQRPSDLVDKAAEYEQVYGRYAGIAQPTLAATDLLIDIFPQRGEVIIAGTYQLVNRSAEEIASIHVATVPEVETSEISLSRQASLTRVNNSGTREKWNHGYRIYSLNKQLQPGDTIKLKFKVRVKSDGFSENGIDPSIVANGTYFSNMNWLPSIGYQSSRELSNATQRREKGLMPKPLIASLYNEEVRKGGA
ncbi:MAG: hypothetical protein EOO04_20385, partial [Chitinophagaceae bacterium]